MAGMNTSGIYGGQEPKTRAEAAGQALKKTLPQLGYHKLHPDAVDPKFGTTQAACFDLAACLSHTDRVTLYWRDGLNYLYTNVKNNLIRVPVGARVLIPTGLILDIPEGHCVKVYSRSSVALKSGMVLANSTGIIDSDYTDELFLMFLNAGQDYVDIMTGDRLGQGELCPVLNYDLHMISEAPGQKGDRTGGFGSTD